MTCSTFSEISPTVHCVLGAGWVGRSTAPTGQLGRASAGELGATTTARVQIRLRAASGAVRAAPRAVGRTTTSGCACSTRLAYLLGLQD